MPRVRIADRALHYWTGRVREPAGGRGLVLLHGAGGNGLGWFMQKHALGTSRFLCAPDLVGHGRSDGEAPNSIEAHVPYVAGLIDVAGIERAALIGHSMGGAVALAFALAHPDRVERMVLIGTGARLPVDQRIFEILTGDPDKAIARLVERVFTAHAPREIVRNVMEQMDFASALPDFTACSRFDVTDRLGELGIPVCVVVGSEDRMTPVALSEQLARSIPGAELHVIEEAGHLPMLEKADAVNAILAEFVDRR